MTHQTLCLTLPFVMLAAIACKPDEPAATPYQPGTTGVAGGPATGPVPTVAPSATAVPTASTTAPAPAPTAPVATDPAVLAQVTPLITKLAATQTVAGSKPLGTAFVGNVGGAVTLEQQIMLTPNKCYSVVAVGLPQISELNVQLMALTVIPGLAPILSVDQDVGPSATLGKKPNCYPFQWVAPVPGKVVITATGGQGVVGAQVFEK